MNEMKPETKPVQKYNAKRIFIGSLPKRNLKKHVLENFSRFGEIASYQFPRNSAGEPRKFCFIEFKESSAAEMAVSEMHQAHYFGHVIEVQIASHQELPAYLVNDQNQKRQRRSKKVKSFPSSHRRQSQMELAPPAQTSVPFTNSPEYSELVGWQNCSWLTPAATPFTTQQLMDQCDQELANLHQLARHIQSKEY